MRYELTEEEWKLITEHRRHQSYLKELWDKQKSCIHKFIDTGIYSGETRYECSICKLVDWK